jgi:hypothetical protein
MAFAWDDAKPAGFKSRKVVALPCHMAAWIVVGGGCG